jgi:hypothetical protein
MGDIDWYRRIVFRSTPVRRAISCWLAPFANSVSMVIRECDFKTFNSWLPRQKGKQRKRPAAQQNRHLPAQVSGGFSGGHHWGSLGGRRGEYWTDEDLRAVQNFLLAAPDAGNLIRGGG